MGIRFSLCVTYERNVLCMPMKGNVVRSCKCLSDNTPSFDIFNCVNEGSLPHQFVKPPSPLQLITKCMSQMLIIHVLNAFMILSSRNIIREGVGI
jgi:hypothetical protein